MHSKMLKNQNSFQKNTSFSKNSDTSDSNKTPGGISPISIPAVSASPPSANTANSSENVTSVKGLRIPFARKTVKINPINRFRPENETELTELLLKIVSIVKSDLSENQTVTLSISRLISCTVKYEKNFIIIENIIITYGAKDGKNHKNRVILSISEPENVKEFSLVCFRDEKCIGEFSGAEELMSLEEVRQVLAIMFFNMLKFKDVCDKCDSFREIIMEFAEDVSSALGNDYGEKKAISPGIHTSATSKNGHISIVIDEDSLQNEAGGGSTQLSLKIDTNNSAASLYLLEDGKSLVSCSDIMEIFLSEEASSCFKIIKEHFYKFFMPKRQELYSVCEEIYSFVSANVGSENFISQSLSQSKKIEMSCYEQTVKISVEEAYVNKDGESVCDSFCAVIPNPAEEDCPVISFSFGSSAEEYTLNGFKEMYENKFSTLVLGILKSCMYEQKMQQNETLSSENSDDNGDPFENTLSKKDKITLSKHKISEFCEECEAVSAYDRDFTLQKPEQLEASISSEANESRSVFKDSTGSLVWNPDNHTDSDDTEFTLLEIKEMLRVLTCIICDTVGESGKIEEKSAGEAYIIDNTKVRIHCIHVDLLHNVETVLLISKTKDIINFICASKDGRSLFYSVINDNIVNNSKACEAIYKMFNHTIRACSNYENAKLAEAQGQSYSDTDGAENKYKV